MNAFDQLAEARLREALARGTFEDLPGAGAPLDLDRHEGVPRELRGAFSVLEQAGYLPEEMVAAGRVHALRELLDALVAAEGHDDERRALTGELERARLRYELAMERRRGHGAALRGTYAARVLARLGRR